MTLQNRVTPLGELVADPARGLLYGNRGCLHDDSGRIRRPFAGRRWIACRLEFRGRRRSPLLQPGRYTELFFLDEPTAFAAGHRPCAECRRADYERFRGLLGVGGADRIDELLHRERVDGKGARRLREAPFAELPDGVIVLHEREPWLVWGRRLLRWTPAGYAEHVSLPARAAPVVTPPAFVDVLRRGWQPLLHPSAGGRRS